MEIKQFLENKLNNEDEIWLKDNFQNKNHRKIISKLLQASKKDIKTYILNGYTDFIKYKHLMKNQNIEMESYFINSNISPVKCFENFNDDVQKTIIKNKAQKLKHRIISNKYEKLCNERTEKLFLEMAQMEFSKQELQDFVGKKIAAFHYYEELNGALMNLIDIKAGWDLNSFSKKIKDAELIENIDYNIVYNKDNKLVLDIHTFKGTSSLGSKMWCIAREEEMFENYKEDLIMYQFAFDFNKNPSEDDSMIASLIKFDGKTTDIFSKSDHNVYSSHNERVNKDLFEKSFVNELVEFNDNINKNKDSWNHVLKEIARYARGYFNEMEYDSKIEFKELMNNIIYEYSQFISRPLNKSDLYDNNITTTYDIKNKESFYIDELDEFNDLFLNIDLSSLFIHKSNDELFYKACDLIKNKSIDSLLTLLNSTIKNKNIDEEKFKYTLDLVNESFNKNIPFKGNSSFGNNWDDFIVKLIDNDPKYLNMVKETNLFDNFIKKIEKSPFIKDNLEDSLGKLRINARDILFNEKIENFDYCLNTFLDGKRLNMISFDYYRRADFNYYTKENIESFFKLFDLEKNAYSELIIYEAFERSFSPYLLTNAPEDSFKKLNYLIELYKDNYDNEKLLRILERNNPLSYIYIPHYDDIESRMIISKDDQDSMPFYDSASEKFELLKKELNESRLKNKKAIKSFIKGNRHFIHDEFKLSFTPFLERIEENLKKENTNRDDIEHYKYITTLLMESKNSISIDNNKLNEIDTKLKNIKLDNKNINTNNKKIKI